jgi:glycosyltransferase involved in cell wall biosynthesis
MGMVKVGICGHFNIGFEAVGGQTIKTRIISENLAKIYSREQIINIDTANWKKRAPMFLYESIKLAIQSDNIIILPATNGVKVLIPLFVFLSKILKRKLHYIVVGAWLPSLLEKNHYLIKPTKNIDFIYAQTNTLIDKLSAFGIVSNVYLMPNFKNIKPLKLDTDKNYKKPYKLCIVSRINYEKGIESAISVINRINEDVHQKVELDIYGPIEKSYEERFNQLLNRYRKFIKYKGLIDYNNTTEVIKEYFLLLFPTKYYTEGFPGTILDAYLSGVPVLASRWESCSDVIIEGVTGYTYEFNNDDDFYKKLQNLIQNKELVTQMKKNCLDEAQKYNVDNAIKILIDNIS